MPATGAPTSKHASGLFGLIPDLLASYMFIVNSDGEILDLNRAAERLLGKEAQELLHRRSGEVLNCVHAAETPGGCGCSAACSVCPLRGSVGELLTGQPRVRKRVRMYLKRDGRFTLFLGVVTATRIEQPDGLFRAFARNRQPG
jgi:PAS domain-containing protein